METKYSKVRNERQMRACIGMDEERLNILSELFEKQYKLEANICYFEMMENLNLPQSIPFLDYKSIVFFILFCEKTGNTYDVLGFMFDMDSSTAHTNLNKFRPILQRALESSGDAPLREVNTLSDMEKIGANGSKLMADATEIPIERRKNKEFRDKSYSGKKKAYRLKTTVISSYHKRITYLGAVFFGSQHDYTIFKIEFPVLKKYFAACYSLLDLGYLGFENSYDCIAVYIPHKKPGKSKGNPNPQLTDQQKADNKAISQERIVVENALAGLKRYYIISNRIRLKKMKCIEETLYLCASLWNFYLSHKKC